MNRFLSIGAALASFALVAGLSSCRAPQGYAGERFSFQLVLASGVSPVDGSEPQARAQDDEPGNGQEDDGSLLKASRHASGLGAFPEAWSAALRWHRRLHGDDQKRDQECTQPAHAYMASPSGMNSLSRM